MKKITLIALSFVLWQNVATAQIQKEDVAIAQSLFSKKKKELIGHYMEIESGNVAFWKLYDECEARRKVIMEERFYLLNEYSEKYDSLDDKSASALAEKFMSSTEEIDNLNKKYYKKFRKLIGGLQATTLFQIELYVQTATQANLQTQIPIIGELQKIQEMQGSISGFGK